MKSYLLRSSALGLLMVAGAFAQDAGTADAPAAAQSGPKFFVQGYAKASYYGAQQDANGKWTPVDVSTQVNAETLLVYPGVTPTTGTLVTAGAASNGAATPAAFHASAASTGYKVANGVSPSDVRNGMGLGHGALMTGNVDIGARGNWNNLEYAYTASFSGDGQLGQYLQGTSGHLRKSYIDLKGKWLALQLGNNTTAADSMGAGYSNVMGASGGANGDFSDGINESSGAVVGDDLVSDAGNATAVSLYTNEDNAKFKGFKLGVTFIPNTGLVGMASPTDNMNMVNGNGSYASMKGGKDKRFNNFSDASQGAFDVNQIAAGLSWTYAPTEVLKGEISVVGLVGTSRGGANISSRQYTSNATSVDPWANQPLTTVAGAAVALPASQSAVRAQWYDQNNNTTPANYLNGFDDPNNSRVKLYDTKAYQVGANVHYKGAELGGTYTDNGKSRVSKFFANRYGGTWDAGKVWSVATAYTMGPWKASAGYSSSKRNFGSAQPTSTATTVATMISDVKQQSTGTVKSVAFDYTPTDGLKFSASYDMATFKTCDMATVIANNTYMGSPITNNAPKVFLLSTSVTF